MPTPQSTISLKGVRVHNLKNISVEIPKGKFVVITGLSGSGKSSLAFDTIHAEGQRRYVESLSAYARQFLELQDRPDVDEISGLSPTIAIDQKTATQNPRSTVGTMTEIYDFLRLLFARAGVPHCPDCQKPVMAQTILQIQEKVVALAKKEEVYILAPMVRGQKGEHKVPLNAAAQSGFTEARYDGTLVDIDELLSTPLQKAVQHDLDIVVGKCAKGAKKVDIEVAIQKGLELGRGQIVILGMDSLTETLLSQSWSCPDCHRSLPPVEPRLFSFNSPHGACPQCSGLGTTLILDPDLVIPNRRLTIAQGAIQPWMRIAGNQSASLRIVECVGQVEKWPMQEAFGSWNATQRNALLNGTGKTYAIDGKDVVFGGVLAMLQEKHRATDSEYVQKEIEAFMRVMVCPSCKGQRLRSEALSVRVANKTIADIVSLPLDQIVTFFKSLSATKSCAKSAEAPTVASLVSSRIATEISRRMGFLMDVGLEYLTLDRSSVTLSGGESQRVRLAVQLGSDLSGVIYVLDEPSIGLHPRDAEKLIAALRRLRDLGNTVIVVEHDRAIMEAADWLIDVGPGAGEHGGQIMASGLVSTVKKSKDSITGKYLRDAEQIPIPSKRRKGNGKSVRIRGASAFQLQDVDVQFPLGMLTCVTGVSGSGKSTLVLDILGRALANTYHHAKDLPAAHKKIEGLEHLDKVVLVDQSPLGRTPRSNPATYTGMFTSIRDLFTETAEAKMRNFDAGMFSFNVKGGGRCETCSGEGMVQIAMQFLPDVYVECGECRGTRYRTEALEVTYRGKNISEVLQMSVQEARLFFADQSALAEKLGLLEEVGLGYLRLGQSATTLSGGEAQRIVLASELSRRSTGKTIYIFDEPTTGLHFEDVKRLLGVLQALVDRGNTVIVIEHDMDVAKCADWVIDLGPGGGIHGGTLVAEGTPEAVAKAKKSVTAPYLKEALG